MCVRCEEQEEHGRQPINASANKFIAAQNWGFFRVKVLEILLDMSLDQVPRISSVLLPR